jgi:uncharacterized protein YuzE
MKERYLEVTFQKGKPIAGYLYLPRAGEAKSARTEETVPGLLIDLSESGEPIGLEITAPGKVTLDDINAALKKLGLDPIGAEELAPLLAA